MTFALPSEFDGLPLIASVSGGKDSTALMLALREAGLEFHAVFADTGWESDVTYEYLDLLRKKIGPIDVVRAAARSGSESESAMVDRIRYRAGFPGRMQRWCTKELKVDPLREYHREISDDTVSVVGVRAEESAERAKLKAVEDDVDWGGWIWRPLIAWTTAEVIEIHHRHDVPLNPLYLRGHDRVGCYPCIFARKEEVRLVAQNDPGRVDQIRELEAEVFQLRAKRNAEQPGRYAHPQGTFFQRSNPLHRDAGIKDPGVVPIDEVVAWSQTGRGGRQLPLLAEPPSGGCFRWGLCEQPSKPK